MGEDYEQGMFFYKTSIENLGLETVRVPIKPTVVDLDLERRANEVRNKIPVMNIIDGKEYKYRLYLAYKGFEYCLDPVRQQKEGDHPDEA